MGATLTKFQVSPELYLKGVQRTDKIELAGKHRLPHRQQMTVLGELCSLYPIPQTLPKILEDLRRYRKSF